MLNLITLYKPLDYDSLEKWYRRIVNLQELRTFGCRFEIDNSNDSFYGIYYDDGLIGINLSQSHNLAQLINTISHEIAHSQEFNHSRKHKAITNEIQNFIKTLLNEKAVCIEKVTRGTARAVNGCNRGNISNLDDIYNKLSGRY